VAVPGSKQAEIDVFSVTGQKVSLQEFGKTDSGYYVEIGKPGIYIMRVKTDNKVYTEKVVVK
jgi:hypothetical protein